MSAGFTKLNPLHIPQPGTTGIATHADASAYPELWEQHVVSWVPCFYQHGNVFPAIQSGTEPFVQGHGLKPPGSDNRQADRTA